MKKLLIHLTSEQHRQLRKYAFDKNVTMAEVIRRSIDNFMNNATEGKSQCVSEKPKDETQTLLENRTPDEKYIFEPEILQIYREVKANQ